MTTVDDWQASTEPRERDLRVIGKVHLFQSNVDRLRRQLQKLRSRITSSSSDDAVSTIFQADQMQLALDGSIDLSTRTMPHHRRRLGGDICAIFIHAGAGYHSVQNEEVHLRACADAAKSAMTFLNNGGDAVDAVEIAIKVLEDREITNAGYGSNLAMDGTVECDATIVDHYGRSGAVGAISQVRNPIHVARLVLDQSTKPMSLRRVPPNLLVGQGATEFAFEQGVPVLPHDALISAAAKERWLKWRADLTKVEAGGGNKSSPEPRSQKPEEHEQRGKQDESDPHESTLRSIWNEGEPISPLPAPETTSMDLSIDGEKNDSSRRPESLYESTADTSISTSQANAGKEKPLESCRERGATTPKQFLTPSPLDPPYKPQHGTDGHENRYGESSDDNSSFIDTDPRWTGTKETLSGPTGGSSTSVGDIPMQYSPIDPPHGPQARARADCVTDTVGAIAVDCFGNIAAGSSSGGIGMKHRGRTGPAALVGIGSAVIPIEPEDSDKVSVATVTSGTGEHMATTMAAATCASRLYHSNRKTKHGGSEQTTEEHAIKAFVERDFMNHPSVRNSHSAGAIGVMGVKKTVNGVWLHFAHNTDSFAVASMHSDEKVPVLVMSRSKGNNSIASGGRSMRYTRLSWARPADTWPANPDDKPDHGPGDQPAKRQKTKAEERPHSRRISISTYVGPMPAIMG